MKRQRGVCVHCGEFGPLYGRRLCAGDYYDPAVRAIYPSGKPTRREWTAKEVALLRELVAAKVPVDRTAELLGRSETQVNSRCGQLGIGRFRRDPANRLRVKRLLDGRRTDGEIATRLGLSRQTVGRIRASLGVPRLPASETSRRVVDAYHHEHGSHAVELRWDRQRLQAAKAGWPVGCTAARARVLAALEAGPLPAAAVAASLGVKPAAVWWHLKAARDEGWVEGGHHGKRGATWRLAESVAERRRVALAQRGM